MALSQDVLDVIAAETMLMYGETVETVTWNHRPSAGAPPVPSPVELHLGQYRQSQVDGEVILKEDRPARIPTSTLSFTPRQDDTFVRMNGEMWKVQQPEGGLGHPFWLIQCRKVG